MAKLIIIEVDDDLELWECNQYLDKMMFKPEYYRNPRMMRFLKNIEEALYLQDAKITRSISKNEE